MRGFQLLNFWKLLKHDMLDENFFLYNKALIYEKCLKSLENYCVRRPVNFLLKGFR